MKNFIFCEVVSLQILKIEFLSLKVYDSVGLDGIKLAYSKKKINKKLLEKLGNI